MPSPGEAEKAAAFVLGVEGARGQDMGHRPSSPPGSRALSLSCPLLQPPPSGIRPPPGMPVTFPIAGPQLGRALPPPRGYFSWSKCPGSATGISWSGQMQKAPNYLGRHVPLSSRSSSSNSSQPHQVAQPGFYTCCALCQEGLPSVPAGAPCMHREGAWT